MKLKSSAIFYALLLSVIVGLLLGGLILFAGINKRLDSQLHIQNKVIQNAHSGIEYGMANYQEIPIEGLQIDLFDQGIDSVQLHIDQWGAYEVITSNAHHKKLYWNKVCLAGKTFQNDAPSLYVCDLGRAISLSGKTKLEGRCMLPKKGLKRAYIEGQNFIGDKLLYGSKESSNLTLPPYDKQFINRILSLPGEIRNWENVDSLKHSFNGKALKLIAENTLVIGEQQLGGQIILEVKDSIFISAEADLSDIILKSKIIHIESGFEGNIQCYASKKITVEDNVILKYPSVLGLVETQFPLKESASITIGEESMVLGSVFAISEDPNFRVPVQVSIAPESEVVGLLYCNGSTELQGTVNGSLYTRKFHLRTASSNYENQLLNANVKNNLPEGFVTIPLLLNDEPLTKIQWLQ